MILQLSPSQIIELLKFPGSPLLLLFIIIYFLLNPEKVEKWGAIFYRIFCFVSLRAEKRYISLNIQGSINSFQRKIKEEFDGLLPYGVKIEWVGEDVTPESIIAEGKVIIRLGYHKNQDENIIRVVSEYIARSIVPEIKHHLSEEIKQAIDFSMTKKLLSSEAPNALNRFYETRYNPEVERKPEIKDLCEMIEAIDDNGWFTRIFLRELKEVGIQLQSKFPDQSIDDEVRDFLKFLYTIVTKRPGEDVRLNFNGDHIKVAVVLVARAEVQSLDPHKQRILTLIDEGIKSIYLSARGKNITLVKYLINCLRDVDNLIKTYDKTYYSKYDDKKIKTICVRYIVQDFS